MHTCNGCNALTDNPKYCSKRCANIVNNHTPKRKLKGACKVCNKPIRSVLSYCSHECKQIKKNQSKKRKAISNTLRVIEWRRRLKLKAIQRLGGRCMKCGYSKCVRALQFHHRNPNEKAFNISRPDTKAWSKVVLEIDKCDLLCANCHAEEEDRIYCGVAQSEQHLAVTQAVRKDIEGSNPSAAAI